MLELKLENNTNCIYAHCESFAMFDLFRDAADIPTDIVLCVSLVEVSLSLKQSNDCRSIISVRRS